MLSKHPQPGHKGYTANNRVRLIRGGKDFFDLVLQLIAGAKESIHLQTYIFDDDETGSRVAEALKDAARRNVAVYLLADGYASNVMKRSFIQAMLDAGIRFRFFQPLFKSKSFYFGRRLHHKVFVVDNRHAMVGGVNITNRYNDLPDHPAWLDFAVYAEGEIAKELCVLCWKTWKEFPVNMGLTPCEKNPPVFHFEKNESSLVRMRRNDFVRGKNQISRSYIELLRNASQQVTILCSYFLPGRTIRRNLENAAKRGVKLRVILASLSDVRIAKHAERYIYHWMLRNGIEIYEYSGVVLHGKMAACDASLVTIGSYNVNNISAYASIELNLDIYDPAFARRTEEHLEQIIRDNCVQIQEEEFLRSSGYLKKFVRWFSYQFIKAGIYVFTFYFRKQR